MHTAGKAQSIKTALFWAVMQRVVVIQYQYSLHNNPEQRSSRLLGGGSLEITRRTLVLNLPVLTVTHTRLKDFEYYRARKKLP
jgi:hypothetical protein